MAYIKLAKRKVTTSNKKIGVIGTGATGGPTYNLALAKDVEELYVSIKA